MRRPFCRLSTAYEFNLALIIALGISGNRNVVATAATWEISPNAELAAEIEAKATINVSNGFIEIALLEK